MTFSICVRERYDDGDGNEHLRFGVAVTTRLAGVGTLCPFVYEAGGVATQSVVNVDLGRKGVSYLADGLAVEDALQGLLNADERRAERQLHGVDADGEFAYSGEDCRDWFGHVVADGVTVAGNLLTGEDVLAETLAAYQDAPADETPLAKRLIDALGAGHAAGGDKREQLPVQSGAVRVARTESFELTPFYDDLRVDATETPIADLQSTYSLAKTSYEQALDLYEETYEKDDESGT